MKLDLLRTFKLPSTVWKNVRVAPTPVVDGTWGPLEPLRGTVWGDLLPVVSGDVMAMAKHGHINPLMQVLGRPPEAQLRMVPAPSRRCGAFKTCATYREVDCHPGKKMPDCYEAPGLSPEAVAAASLVALAWRDGVYVVIVDGPEFNP
jgi:hypothetical protein